MPTAVPASSRDYLGKLTLNNLVEAAIKLIVHSRRVVCQHGYFFLRVHNSERRGNWGRRGCMERVPRRSRHRCHRSSNSRAISFQLGQSKRHLSAVDGDLEFQYEAIIKINPLIELDDTLTDCCPLLSGIQHPQTKSHNLLHLQPTPTATGACIIDNKNNTGADVASAAAAAVVEGYFYYSVLRARLCWP